MSIVTGRVFRRTRTNPRSNGELDELSRQPSAVELRRALRREKRERHREAKRKRRDAVKEERLARRERRRQQREARYSSGGGPALLSPVSSRSVRTQTSIDQGGPLQPHGSVRESAEGIDVFYDLGGPGPGHLPAAGSLRNSLHLHRARTPRDPAAPALSTEDSFSDLTDSTSDSTSDWTETDGETSATKPSARPRSLPKPPTHGRKEGRRLETLQEGEEDRGAGGGGRRLPERDRSASAAPGALSSVASAPPTGANPLVALVLWLVALVSALLAALGIVAKAPSAPARRPPTALPSDARRHPAMTQAKAPRAMTAAAATETSPTPTKASAPAPSAQDLMAAAAAPRPLGAPPTSESPVSLKPAHKPAVVPPLASLDSVRSSLQRASLLAPLEPRRQVAGQTVPRRDPTLTDPHEGTRVYTQAPAADFKLRGKNYMRDKKKETCHLCFYEVFGMDAFLCEEKVPHVARRVQLPEGMLRGPSRFPGVPDYLVMQYMLPVYTPTMFGHRDGRGVALIYYCKLREDLDLDHTEYPEAVALLRQFMEEAGKGDEGRPFMDRLKVIPRAVNTEEWMASTNLSSAESKLLRSYNDKPMMARPQYYVFKEKNYIEIDLDAHIYNFLARRTMHSFFTRLGTMVFDNAFCIQGNVSEELPEALLAAIRIYRLEFSDLPPLAAMGSGSVPTSTRGSPRGHDQAAMLKQGLPAMRPAVEDSRAEGGWMTDGEL